MTEASQPAEGLQGAPEPFHHRLLQAVLDDEHARQMVLSDPVKPIGTILLTHSQYRALMTEGPAHEIQDQGLYWRGMRLIRVADDHDTVLDARWIDAREI